MSITSGPAALGSIWRTIAQLAGVDRAGEHVGLDGPACRRRADLDGRVAARLAHADARVEPGVAVDDVVAAAALDEVAAVAAEEDVAAGERRRPAEQLAEAADAGSGW